MSEREFLSLNIKTDVLRGSSQHQKKQKQKKEREKFVGQVHVSLKKMYVKGPFDVLNLKHEKHFDMRYP